MKLTPEQIEIVTAQLRRTHGVTLGELSEALRIRYGPDRRSDPAFPGQKRLPAARYRRARERIFALEVEDGEVFEKAIREWLGEEIRDASGRVVEYSREIPVAPQRAYGEPNTLPKVAHTRRKQNLRVKRAPGGHLLHTR